MLQMFGSEVIWGTYTTSRRHVVERIQRVLCDSDGLLMCAYASMCPQPSNATASGLRALKRGPGRGGSFVKVGVRRDEMLSKLAVNAKLTSISKLVVALIILSRP